MGRYFQDGEGVRHGDHLAPHKYIKNTSAHEAAPTKRKEEEQKKLIEIRKIMETKELGQDLL